MKIVVDKALCAGHARCRAAAPEVVELDDDGYIAFSEKVVPEGQEEAARKASRVCPERVIQIVDDANA
jgi:ferredoxin